MSTYLGYLTAGTKVIDKNNFYWGILHSKNPPSWGFERLKMAKDVKMYKHNPETNGVFQGNQHRSVTNVGNVSKKVDKVAGKLNLIKETSEIAVIYREKGLCCTNLPLKAYSTL